MSAALILRQSNPDDDFVLHGSPALYTERTSFYPTNSDITLSTKNLSQHKYRANVYKDILNDDQNLRSSLRSMSRSLRMVSNDIRKNLEEDSTAKQYLGNTTTAADLTSTGTANLNGYDAGLYEEEEPQYRRRDDREWLADSEWNTSSGHHVTFADNLATQTLLNRTPSLALTDIFRRSRDNAQEAERLRRTVNVDMGLAEVPATRFTRKDLLASEYFPVTMTTSSASQSLGRSRSPGRSRSRSRTRHAESARLRAKTPDRTPITDNFHSMKRLEKLYLVTNEAPATASAPTAILSPYLEEIARLRMERLRLEENHLNELTRLVTLERSRGPKPKWYELKDAQFHFEAGKNNDLLRSQNNWSSLSLKNQSRELSQSHPDLFSLRTRSLSFS